MNLQATYFYENALLIDWEVRLYATSSLAKDVWAICQLKPYTYHFDVQGNMSV